MTPNDAKDDLATTLDRVGFQFISPNLAQGWDAFSKHVAVPVKDVVNYMMVELGTFSNLGSWLPYEPAFVVDLCRQFEFKDLDGEFNHYEQLHLTFFAPPSALTDSIKENYFVEVGQSLCSYLAAIEQSVWFRTLQSYPFSHVKLEQWVV